MENNKQIPFFSIIIPTLNEEYHLPRLLDDLVKQTFSNFEVIIVDAKSNDKTQKKAKPYQNKFSTFVLLESDKRNVSFQRNFGARKAQANYIIFMDADNRLPNYFLQGIKFHIEVKNPDILSTWIEPDTRNRKDKAIATVINLAIELLSTSNNPTVLESMVCVKKRSFKHLGGFNEKIHWAEGAEMLKRAKIKRLNFVMVRNPKYQYSFRRIRKQGTFKMLNNIAQNELAILIKKQISKEKAKTLYPMEGGAYFEISPNEKNRIEKFFMKFASNTQSKIENGNNNLFKFLSKKLFK